MIVYLKKDSYEIPAHKMVNAKTTDARQKPWAIEIKK